MEVKYHSLGVSVREHLEEFIYCVSQLVRQKLLKFFAISEN